METEFGYVPPAAWCFILPALLFFLVCIAYLLREMLWHQKIGEGTIELENAAGEVEVVMELPDDDFIEGEAEEGEGLLLTDMETQQTFFIHGTWEE